jgi:alanine or glycine:cation symporter, AGCS family
VNNIAQAMDSAFGIEPIVTGAVLSVVLGLVIIGGIKRIAAVTAKLMPIMALFYLIGALGVLVVHAGNIGPAFLSVFRDAFTGSAAMGGFLGASLAFAFNRGVNRGLFSNEAGQGSAPIAHAAARADEPVSEGMVSILEPFIDTLCICTLTGIVILASGVWKEKVPNTFQGADMQIVTGAWNDTDPAHRSQLYGYLAGDAASAVKAVGGRALGGRGGDVPQRPLGGGGR